ncbi:MAG: hypothetical protein WC752_04655 [Patescibacteria group bacterium]|jgi:capsular polysaccharide biosynthesis protein
MELSQHAKIIQKHKWFIIVFALLVGALSLVVAYSKPVSYKASVSFDVNLINRASTADYQYGSYYDLKGAEMFTQNAMSWLRTPAVVGEIYEKAGMGYEVKNLDKFTNRFKTRQYAAQNFVVTFDDLSAANAEKIAESLSTVISERSAVSSTDKDNKSLFEVKAAKPIIVKNVLNIYLVTILGVLAGLVFGTVLVYLKFYIQNSK